MLLFLLLIQGICNIGQTSCWQNRALMSQVFCCNIGWFLFLFISLLQLRVFVSTNTLCLCVVIQHRVAFVSIAPHQLSTQGILSVTVLADSNIGYFGISSHISQTAAMGFQLLISIEAQQMACMACLWSSMCTKLNIMLRALSSFK